jgi:hypothetical protein
MSLLVGQTIIESLKFACTGQQPPLSDGGKSFVHDPKVTTKPLPHMYTMLLNICSD